jgi:NAD(P)-dependent dehydrogenase (short-subunit alcohol dehydrogenase family)
MKKVIITGASQGVGLAVALKCLEKNNQVFACMRNVHSAPDELENAISEKNNGSMIIKMDVTEDSSVRTAINEILDSTDSIDTLVNNAGTFHEEAFEKTSIDSIKRVFETNFYGPIRTMQAILPHFRKQKHGHVINVTSAAVDVTPPMQSAYTASKTALDGISRSMSMEVDDHGITVSAVEFGRIATNLVPNFMKQITLDEKSPYYGIESSFYKLNMKLNRDAIPASEIADEIYEVIAAGKNAKYKNPLGDEARFWIDSINERGSEFFVKGGLKDIIRNLTKDL